ncbi:hypothetical protein ASD04_14800 [Devosia sp. Root436]|nr:hypothetical protein ASD04_14800 [Devosia sp. Root436]
MSSSDIAKLTHKRHDNVKRTIVALADAGVMTLPQIEETSFLDTKGKAQYTTAYRLIERDTYVVVAKLSPKFMAAVVDEWIDLRGGISLHGGAKFDLIEFADRARTDIEAVRDLIAREGHGTRGALIKAVKELAGNPIGALKSYLDDRFMASRERDKMVIGSLATLDRSVGQVLALARRALEPDAFVAGDWVAVSGVYALAGVNGPVPRQKSLSARLTVSLVAFCIETHRQMDMRGINFDRKVHLYRATAVRAWLKDRGKALIDQHIAKHSAQTVIAFPGQPVEGGAK